MWRPSAVALCLLCVIGAEPTGVHSWNCSESAHPAAYNWTSRFDEVVIDAWNGELRLKFVGPETDFCFEAYSLSLRQRGSENNLKIVKLPTEKLYEASGNRMLGSVKFDRLLPGLYDIKLTPQSISVVHESKEVFHQMRCICPQPVVSTNLSYAHKEIRCGCAETHFYGLRLGEFLPNEQVPEDSCASDPYLPHCLAPIDTGKDLCKGTDPTESLIDEIPNGLIVVAFVLLLVETIALLAVAGMVFRLLKRRSQRNRRCLHKHVDWAKEETVSPESQELLDRPKQGDSATQPRLVRVLLIYSRDSPAHENAVRMLAKLIKESGPSLVTYDELEIELVSRNKIDWACRTILEADKIIFVHSEGAFYRYHLKMASLNVRVVSRQTASAVDDLFLLQLDYLLQNPKFRGKCLSVQFAFTPDNFVLNSMTPHSCYRLPLLLPALLRKVSASGDTVSLDSELAQPLLRAISLVQSFQRESPDWFKSLHQISDLRPLQIGNQTNNNSFPAPQVLSKELSPGIKNRKVAGNFCPEEESNVEVYELPVETFCQECIEESSRLGADWSKREGERADADWLEDVRGDIGGKQLLNRLGATEGAADSGVSCSSNSLVISEN